MLFLNSLSTWEPLPDLPIVRQNHGCDRVDMNNNPYLIVYGGDAPGITRFGDIAFLNLNQKSHGWVNLPGISLSGAKRFINGGIVKHLSSTNCDLMFVDSSGLNVCKGNFHWTTTTLNPAIVTGWKKMVAVGLSVFPTCV